MLEGSVVTATPTKVIAEYGFVDHRTMDPKNIHNISFSGTIYDKTPNYDTSFSVDRTKYRIYLGDPNEPYQPGDTLFANFGQDSFINEDAYHRIELSLTELDDADLPIFVTNREVMSASKEKLDILVSISGDNTFVQNADYTPLLANYGLVTTHPHTLTTEVSKNGKQLRMIFETTNGAQFENGEDLSIVFLPTAFDIPMNDNWEVVCILINTIAA